MQAPAENAAAETQSDAVPGVSDGAAQGLGNELFDHIPSQTSIPSHGLRAFVATDVGAQPAADAVCDSLVDEGSQPLFKPAPVSNAAAEHQTASAFLLHGQAGAEQAAGSSQVLQPADLPAAPGASLDKQSGAEQADPVPQPLQPSERLAKGREVVALMQQ